MLPAAATGDVRDERRGFRFLGRLGDQLPALPVGRVVAGALLVCLVGAWSNGGFLSLDEHFQILEFAWYKLGHAPPQTLPWEFGERMRAGLQPLVAAWVIQVLDAGGVFTPFFAAFVLRLLSALLGLWVSLELCARVLGWVRHQRLKSALFVGTLFLWFLPCVHGRFSSENWGGLLFFGGLCLLIDAVEDGSDGIPAVLRSMGAGLLGGGAFYCRFQIAFAIAGAGLWLLFVRKAPARIVAALIVSFLLACGLNTIVDHWLYGAWVVSPYHYLRANIIEGKAAVFGTRPWWFYGGQFLIYLVPPYSVLLLGIAIGGVWLCRRNVLVWAAVPFVVGHSLVGHKEARFLIPLTYALVPLLVLAADNLPERVGAVLAGWYRSRGGRVATRVFVALNAVALIGMTIKPVSETDAVYRWLYRESRNRSITVYTVTGSPYVLVTLPVWFYRADNVTVKTLHSTSELVEAEAAAPGTVFFFHRAFDPPRWLAAGGIQTTPVVRTVPNLAARFNVNDWISRMHVWTIFAVAPSPGPAPGR